MSRIFVPLTSSLDIAKNIIQEENIMLTKEENSMEIDEHTTYPAKTEEREK